MAPGYAFKQLKRCLDRHIPSPIAVMSEAPIKETSNKSAKNYRLCMKFSKLFASLQVLPWATFIPNLQILIFAPVCHYTGFTELTALTKHPSGSRKIAAGCSCISIFPKPFSSRHSISYRAPVQLHYKINNMSGYKNISLMPATSDSVHAQNNLKI